MRVVNSVFLDVSAFVKEFFVSKRKSKVDNDKKIEKSIKIIIQ